MYRVVKKMVNRPTIVLNKNYYTVDPLVSSQNKKAFFDRFDDGKH